MKPPWFLIPLFAAAIPLSAADVPKGGKPVLKDPLSALELHGEGAVVEKGKAEGTPSGRTLRLKTPGGAGNPWDVQIQAPTEAPVAKGDTLLAAFYLRAISSRAESAEVQTEFVFELAREPWTKSVSYPVRAGKEWIHFFVPFVSEADYAPGEAQVIFRLGYDAPQALELGDVQVLNYGKKLKPGDLPRTKITYPGREPGAAWRAAAKERIERIRKADLAVRVVDADGKPVPGASVQAVMQRHAFAFGSAVSSQTLLRGIYQEDRETYRKRIPELFNLVTLENAFKWPAWEGEWGSNWGRDNALAAARWLKEQGIPQRGHVLVWPSWRNLPKRLVALTDDKKALRRAVLEHIRDVVGAARGLVTHWDVVNEPFDNHDLMDLLGDDVLVEWFREARKVDPAAKLYLNDYAILSGGGGNTAHRDHFEKTARFLLEKGAPLDGLGMQGHFGLALTAPEDLWALLDRYAALGRPILVTEYDITADDPDLAADYTRDFHTALFAHPAVEGIVMWGFWDGAHWHRNAPLFHRDWTWKKSGEEWRRLVFGEWWTKESGKSDGEGAWRTRGFLGRYEVSAQAGGKKGSRTVELTPSLGLVTVVLR